jgi:hypothetical protein
MAVAIIASFYSTLPTDVRKPLGPGFGSAHPTKIED